MAGKTNPRPAANGQLARAELAALAFAIERGNADLPPATGKLIAAAPESFSDLRFGKIAGHVRAMRESGQAVYLDSVAAKSGEALFVLRELSIALPADLAEMEAQSALAAFEVRRARSIFHDGLAALDASPSKSRSILASVRAALAEATGEATEGLPAIIDAAAFMAEPQTAPPELIAGVLHRGSKLALGGSSKAFKTWTLLDMAVSVAHGLPWLGFGTAKGKVLFVNFEIQPYAWHRRISAVTNAKGVEMQPGQIALWNLRGHAADFSKLVPRVIERAKQESFALIVLDPIYKLYGGTDENSAGDVAALLNSLERLATETGAAVCYGCHFAKGNASAKEAIDRISGSGVFARDPDSLLIFTKHDQPEAFTVDPILRNFAPIEPFVVRWQYPLFQPATDLDPAKLKQVAGRKREHDPAKLLAFIANHDAENPISVSQWADLAEIPRKTLSDYLAEMRSKNWIKTISEGSRAKQAITNEGKAFINL